MTQLTVTPWQQGLEPASIKRIDQLAIDTRAALHKLRSAWVDVADLLATAQQEMTPSAFASWYQQELGLNKQKVSEFVAAKWVMDYAPGVFNDTNSSARALRLLKAADDELLMSLAIGHVETGHKLTRTWVEDQKREVEGSRFEQAHRNGWVKDPQTGKYVPPEQIPGYVTPRSHYKRSPHEKLSRGEELLAAARARKEEAERRWEEVKPQPKLDLVTTENFFAPAPVAPGDPAPASEQTVEVSAAEPEVEFDSANGYQLRNTELDDAYERIAELEARLLVIGEWTEGLAYNGQEEIRRAMPEEVERAIADETFEIPFEDDSNPAHFLLMKIEWTPAGRARLGLKHTETLVREVLAKSDNYCPEVIAECKNTFRQLADEIVDWL